VTNQTSKQGTEIILGLGQLRVAREEKLVLTSLGLGSCVAICAYDPISKVGGMAHMVLPRTSDGRSNEPNPKFVDCAIPMLLEEMEQLGALKSRLIVKIVGGAEMMTTKSPNGTLNIGPQNVEAVETVLAELGLPLRGADIGGTHGRTARLYLDSGKLLVSAVGGARREL
jgi:chemotaxis protein CheD